MFKLRVAVAAIVCSVSATAPLPAWPADGDKPNRVERTAQKAIDATERTAKRAGKFVEKTATRAGKFVERTATKTGNAVKRAVE
jgi:hypothetical protein